MYVVRHTMLVSTKHMCTVPVKKLKYLLTGLLEILLRFAIRFARGSFTLHYQFVVHVPLHIVPPEPHSTLPGQGPEMSGSNDP